MKTITTKIKALWAKLPERAQSAVRHLSLTFALTFALTAKALLSTDLPAILHAPDLKTKAALAATGIRVHDIELARIYEGMDPKSYLPAMEVAAELGARAVLSSIWSGERDFYIEKFAEVKAGLGHGGGGYLVRRFPTGGNHRTIA